MKDKFKFAGTVLCFFVSMIGGILSLIVVSFLFYGCSGEINQSDRRLKVGSEIRIVSWNVQTFFDAQTQGAEYAEFRGSKSLWTEEKYIRRLERLCDSIKILDADILVLQEIENEAVLRDIINFLAEKNPYQYLCFASSEDASIGCGILSRLPITNPLVHQIDFRIHGNQPQLRPLLEVTVANTAGTPVCTLFVCHWKSKSGGDELAAVWQTEQERLIGARISELLCSVHTNTEQCLCLPIVICGDFNRDISEFTPNSSFSHSIFLGAVPVISGWFSPDLYNTSMGSYFYQGDWERIDHIFVAGNIELTDFSAVMNGPWVRISDNGEKIPFRYSVWNGQGYSDHLPVAGTIRIPSFQ